MKASNNLFKKQYENIQLMEGNSKTTEGTNGAYLASTGTSQGFGKDGECLRRIKREWKDAIQNGIAYD